MDLSDPLTLLRQNDKEDSWQLIGLQIEVAVCSLLGAIEGVPNVLSAGIRVDNKLRRDAPARVNALWQLHAIVAACRQLIGKEGLHTQAIQMLQVPFSPLQESLVLGKSLV